MAFPLLAATLTRDPVLIAGLSAVQFLPWLLFALAAGVLVDRVDRRTAMIVANLVRAAVVGVTAVLVYAGAVSIWVVYVAAFLIGIAETVADSAANVLIPAVVRREQLESANGKLQAAEIVGQTFLGGPVGSVTFAVFAVFPFLLNSVGFALAAALLIGMAGSYRPKKNAGGAEAATTVRADLADGLRWLRRSPVLLRLVLVAGMLSLASELAQAQLVLYALEDLDLTEAAFGLFALVGGIGGLLGAVVAARLIKAFSRRAVLGGGTLLCGLGFCGMGLVSQPLTSAALFGVFAMAIVAVNVVLGTVRHSLVPEELLGRVLGAWRTVVWGAVPVGALLGGVLTQVLGSSSGTFVVSGAVLVGLAGVAVVATRRFRAEIEPQPVTRA